MMQFIKNYQNNKIRWYKLNNFLSPTAIIAYMDLYKKALKKLGNKPNPMHGFKHSKETKQKISNLYKRR